MRTAAVALGAVAPTPLLAAQAGEFLVGKEPTAEVLAEAGELASAESKPIGDHRSPREYRLELVKVLVRRAVARAVERGRG